MSGQHAVLITGASARIGAALARGLAQAGWAVAIHYNRSKDSAAALTNAINKDGGKAVIVHANLNVAQERGDLIARASKALGQPLTALINNASTFSPDTIDTLTDASFDHHINANLRAPLMLSQQFAAQIPDGIKGNIINMIDQRMLNPKPGFLSYAISKAGLHWATTTLAQALAPNIRVNAIAPGPTLQSQHQSEAQFNAEQSATLLGEGSSPQALLGAALYLLSASAVTGQMITVDGGQHLSWEAPNGR
ncbi:MAG: SDR family oxidoreductase [Robiginitomaculum sp.]